MQKIISKYSNIKLRIISALILAPVLISAILWNKLLFNILMGLVSIGMLYEWGRMPLKPEGSDNNGKAQILAHFLLGLPIILIPMISLILVRVSNENRLLLLGYFITIWSVDTFAMIGGKKLQGTRLAPKLSPNKTRSGLFTGMIFSAIIAVIFDVSTSYAVTDRLQLSKGEFMFSIAIFAVIAQVSDLFISYFKRQYNIKDSGAIIPGHGGLLDRFDSIILTAPILYYVLNNLRPI